MNSVDGISTGEGSMRPSSRFAESLLSKISSSVLPFAERFGFALSWTSPGSKLWLARHQACTCDEEVATPTAVSRLEVRHDGKVIGELMLCPGRLAPDMLESLLAVSEMSIRQTQLEFEEEALLSELAESWESLDTLFEITSDLKFLLRPGEILERIISRAVAGIPASRAVLWIETGGRLEPATSYNWSEARARDATSGLVGRALASSETVALSEERRIREIPDLEPELRSASRVAVAPITTRNRLVGALQVWDESLEGKLDSHRVRLIEALALQAATVVESERSYRTSLEVERMRNDVETGARIQKLLLSARPPVARPGLDIAVLSVPSRLIDGDFYDFIEFPDGTIDLFVGDVMGKGVPAALVGAAAKGHLLRTIAVRTGAQKIASPAEIVTRAHRKMSRSLIELESFVSLMYCRIDPKLRSLTFVDCGHTNSLHFSRDSGALSVLKGENLPLGILEDEMYGECELSCQSGDTVIVYSDGVTEARNAEGEFFGEERLGELVRQHSSLQAEALLERLRDSIVSFCGSSSFRDDLTCVVIKFGDAGPGVLSRQTSTEFVSNLQQLAPMRAWLRGFVSQSGMQIDDQVFRLELAATEVMSNIIRHAYAGRAGHPISAFASIENTSLTLVFSHWGQGRRPDRAELPELNGDRTGGFGNYIISSIVDDVTFSEDADGRCHVKLVKQLNR